jgi:hypothetical protein
MEADHGPWHLPDHPLAVTRVPPLGDALQDSVSACVGGPAHLAASRLGAAGYVDLPRPAAAIVSCPQQFAHASSKRRERRLVASLPRRLSRLKCPCRARLQNTVKRCPQGAWRLRLADWTTESHVGASLSEALPSTAPSSRICDKSPRRIA